MAGANLVMQMLRWGRSVMVQMLVVKFAVVKSCCSESLLMQKLVGAKAWRCKCLSDLVGVVARGWKNFLV